MNISNDILGIWIFIISVMVIPYICWRLASISNKQNEIKNMLKNIEKHTVPSSEVEKRDNE